MDENTPCAICRRPIEQGSGYIVQIEVFADPKLPAMTGGQIESANLNAALAEVIEQTKHLSADELQDGVHRRFEYALCPACHRKYLSNPLGLPRQARVGKN